MTACSHTLLKNLLAMTLEHLEWPPGQLGKKLFHCSAVQLVPETGTELDVHGRQLRYVSTA